MGNAILLCQGNHGMISCLAKNCTPGCPGDAMCFLTDGAIGFEPIVVEGCWDVTPKALRTFCS